MSAERISNINYHVSEHFMYSDFICPCCDTLKIVPGFYRHVEMLEKLLVEFKTPFRITSAYRCVSHNTRIGGAVGSWHLLFATDIAPLNATEEEVKRLYASSQKIGFRGIGLYDCHVHVDMRAKDARWRG